MIVLASDSGIPASAVARSSVSAALGCFSFSKYWLYSAKNTSQLWISGDRLLSRSAASHFRSKECWRWSSASLLLRESSDWVPRAACLAPFHSLLTFHNLVGHLWAALFLEVLNHPMRIQRVCDRSAESGGCRVRVRNAVF